MHLSIFSLLPGHRAEPARDLYEVALTRAALADELGFHGFWVAEHHARSVSRMASPAVFLAAVAQRTKRIRLGVAVVVLPFHDPLLVAEEFALVDCLSGGRLDLGVGSGISPVEYAALGQSVDDKRARFEESLSMIRHAWSDTGGPITGDHHSYGDLFCGIPTVQKPAPPVWRAVGSVEAARATGEEGDAALFLTAPDLSNHEDIAEMTRVYQLGFGSNANATTGGETPAPVVGAALFTTVAATDDEARKRAVRSFDRMADARGQESQGNDIVEAAAKGGRGFFGSPATIATSLRLLAESGVTDALLWLDFGGAPEAEIEESLKLLASEVAPVVSQDSF